MTGLVDRLAPDDTEPPCPDCHAPPGDECHWDCPNRYEEVTDADTRTEQGTSRIPG